MTGLLALIGWRLYIRANGGDYATTTMRWRMKKTKCPRCKVLESEASATKRQVEAYRARVLEMEATLGEANRKLDTAGGGGPHRERLPDTRESITKKFHVTKQDGTDMKVYAIAGMYADGRLGELFLHADKVGSTAHGALDAAAISFSVALQYGIPLRVITSKWKGTKFGPEGGKIGDVKNPRGVSILSLVATWLEEKFPEGV